MSWYSQFRRWRRLFLDAGILWNQHNAPRLGAALAYYSVLSMAPALVVAISISGVVFGPQAVRGEIYGELKDVVGSQSAAFVETFLKSAYQPAGFAGLLGLVTMILGASGVVIELRDTLNYIWEAPHQTSYGVWGIIRDRFFSFAVVIGVGFLLTLSLALSAIVQSVKIYSATFLTFPAYFVETANFVVTLVMAAFLFALIYRFIPEVAVDWQDVAIGSLVTALLFSVGRLLIGLYLGKVGIGSAYGAAGSIVALLVWVYYSAQIFLYGAEFTHVCAKRRISVRSADGHL